VDHLDLVPGQTDHALDVVGRIVARQLEDGDVAALRLGGPRMCLGRSVALTMQIFHGAADLLWTIIACHDVKARCRIVLYPGTERYRLDANTEAVPAAQALTGGLVA